MNKKFFLQSVLVAFLLLCSLCFFYTKYTTCTKNIYNTRPVIVSQGDTLWSIAKREFPGSEWDLQEVIYYIREVNPGLNPGSLQRGQEIRIPVFFREEVRDERCSRAFREDVPGTPH